MSLIIANTSSNPVPKNNYVDAEEETQRARERKTALKAIVIVIIFISIMCFVLYYVVHYLQLKDQHEMNNNSNKIITQKSQNYSFSQNKQ
ncbi:hypothetical protein PVAND_001358 [Polypedilum vanderplanki]|uniref:Uncharacterized protein n=1 Tax=Polypedilum vanderplanki TaxID=319348 RepID=A0A9J6BMP2_POLVA|nr:hypothetical protein PVAND_001358 [Polypedilum vanderplanki]